MHRIRRWIALVAVAGAIGLALSPAEAGRRGGFGHHSQVKVWHGNRLVAWNNGGRWQRHDGQFSNRGWHGSSSHWNSNWHSNWNSSWKSGWAWSRGQGYPHRWWSWNSRKHQRFASRGHHRRHATHNGGHGSHGSGFDHGPRRQGVWYASPAFGSNVRGPVRQGEWHAD